MPGGRYGEALPPAKHITQYAHTAWRTQDGFFSGTPTAIAQTSDGYLWVGTEGGLLRFDGVRFVPWTPPNGKQLRSISVFSLLGARDGSLWIGTDRGLSHWKDGDLTEYGKVRARIESILEDRRGTIWITRGRVQDSSGPLCQIQSGLLKCYSKANGIPNRTANALAQDAEGSIWFGSETNLVRWRPDSSSVYPLSSGEKFVGLSGVEALAAAPDNSLWVGMNHLGPGLGLQRLVQGKWRSVVMPSFNGTSLSVSALLLDRDGALWIGTETQGIYRIHNGVADHFDSADGLSGDFVQGLFQDHEGNIWVTTTKGIDSFRNRPVVVFSKREGLTADSVSSVLASPEGTVWIGNADALDSFHDGKISSMTAKGGLPGKIVTSLLEDHTGLLWVGVDNGLFVYQSGRFRPILKPDGRPVGFVERMIEDTDGDVWAEVSGVAGGFVRIRNRKIVEQSADPDMQRSLAVVADPQGGIWLGLRNGDLARYRQNRMERIPASPGARERLLRLVVNSDGVVWGAASTGLVGWKKGKLQTLAVRNGLPCADIYAMVVDNQHALWLDAACGLIRIAATELQRWWENPDAKVKPLVLDVFDGFQAGNPSFDPAASRSPDGRLWFANESVLQMVDPAHLEGNTLSPPVHVEQISASGKAYPPRPGVRLPSLTRDIEIDYTALSFVMPQRVRFRYKLEGHDTGWQEADTRRSAFYTNLSPAHYRFHVIACNNDGVWNEQGAMLDFIIPPAWYQTSWFRVLCVVGLIALCYVLYRRKVRQVAESMRSRFDERLEERTRVARDLHDTLIQTIQGSKLVVDNARSGPPDLARMQKAIDLLSDWLDRAVMEGRAALSSLRGSTTEGNDLAEALRRACDDCRLGKFIDASFSLRGQSREIHPIFRDDVYRIGYEAIQNACAHSGGSRIIAELEYGPNLRLSVRDNGKGIDEETLRLGKTGHFGLTGMRERASRIGGKLTISSSAGGGTELILLVPGRSIFRVT